MVVIDENNYLAHYGTLHKSGRYPWGSSNNEQSPRHMTWLDYVKEMRSKGLSDPQIAEGMGITTTQFRARHSIARHEKMLEQISTAQNLHDKGMSGVAASRQMGIPESTYRTLLEPGAKDRADLLTTTANTLKEEVAKSKYVEVGSGVESYLGLSKERLAVAVEMLKEEGYVTHEVPIPQLGTGLDTRMKVLAPPGTTQREVFDNRNQIKLPFKYSDNGGRSYAGIHDPISIHPNRIEVKYKENGGDKADGMIYVRPGVEDISLGKSRYSQVRILVGDGHYLKGMAMYKDNLPPGVDLVFNTKKSSTGNKLDAMKEIGKDKDYPFGSIVHQILADPGTPNERVTSAMNLVGTKEGAGEEGSWGKWSKNLSAQFLSKQSPTLAKAQLNTTFDRRKKEFDEINSLTNPTVKKKLLESFAEDTDSAAVHLKAASLPRASWHAILPIESMPRTQIYAPNFDDGDTVALVRYPHGGTFEIPKLTVNNHQPEARRLLGNAEDAVGIHHSVAERLSGADFDGDTVLVIKDNAGKVKTSPALEGLKGFDTMKYKLPDDSPIPRITSSRKQQEMGIVSNLITDMTLKQAPHSEIVRAIRHSMVVIDSEKHGLNYKLSAQENGISALKQKYQGGPRAGAATLISRKKSTFDLPDRKARPQAQGGPINRDTGKKEFVETGKLRRTKDGELVPSTKKFNKLAEADDAHTLSSGTNMERLYADHSNRLKSLANAARLAAVNTPPLKYSPSASKVYAKEVSSLNAKLALVIRNRPLERQAQVLASAAVKAKRDANPNLDKDSIRKLKWKEQELARIRTGAKGTKVEITADEWNAIQAGAITDNKLTQILAKANLDTVRKLATPRRTLLMSPTKTARAKALLASGHTRAEVAKVLGVSLTTLDVATKQ